MAIDQFGKWFQFRLISVLFCELHLTFQSHNIFLSIEMTHSLLPEEQGHCLLKVAVEIE